MYESMVISVVTTIMISQCKTSHSTVELKLFWSNEQLVKPETTSCLLTACWKIARYSH